MGGAIFINATMNTELSIYLNNNIFYCNLANFGGGLYASNT